MSTTTISVYSHVRFVFTFIWFVEDSCLFNVNICIHLLTLVSYAISTSHAILVNCLHFRCTSIHPLLLVGIRVAQVFNVLYGAFTWRSLFVLWFFFFWSLHCLSLCDLRPLITPLGILKLFWDFHYLFYALPTYLQKKANQIVSCW